MKRLTVYFFGLSVMALLGAIFYSVRLTMPEQSDAIEMASVRALEMYENKCRRPENISVTTKVIATGEDRYHVGTEAVSPEVVPRSESPLVIDSFIYPSIDFGLIKASNIDVIGVTIRF